MAVFPSSPMPDSGKTDAMGYFRTNWSLIMDAVSDHTHGSASAMDRLVRRYWPAVFAFIRSSAKMDKTCAEHVRGLVDRAIRTLDAPSAE